MSNVPWKAKSPWVENYLLKASHRFSPDLRGEAEEGMHTRRLGSLRAISVIDSYLYYYL